MIDFILNTCFVSLFLVMLFVIIMFLIVVMGFGIKVLLSLLTGKDWLC